MAAWWQTTRTPKQGFWLAAWFLALGLVGLVSALVGASNVLQLVCGVGFTALGAVHLASATALRRRHGSTHGEGQGR